MSHIMCYGKTNHKNFKNAQEKGKTTVAGTQGENQNVRICGAAVSKNCEILHSRPSDEA